MRQRRDYPRESIPKSQMASGGALFAEVGNNLVAVSGFYPAAFQVIIAAVEHFARLCEFVEVSGNDIFYQFTGGTSGFGCELIELGLQVGGEMYFHGFSVRERIGWGKL